MKPAEFPQANVKLVAPATMTPEECGTLPVYTDGETCLSSWRLDWRDRLSVLLFGRIWVWLWSGDTQPPILLGAMKSPWAVARARARAKQLEARG